MARSLGVLSLDLIAKVGGFVQGMDKAARESEKRMKQIKATAVKLGRDIGIGLSVGAAAFTALIKSAINTADEMGKTAAAVGLTTESFSQLDYAAKLSGVDDLSGSLVKFNKVIVEAAQGVAKPRAAFDALGISLRDTNGRLRSNEELFNDVADAVAKYGDSAGKTKVVLDLFGESGAKLINLLNQGAAGIQKFRDESDALRYTVSEGVSRAAADFNDNLTRLREAINGTAKETASALAPSLKVLTDMLVESAIGSREASDGLREMQLRVAAVGAAALHTADRVMAVSEAVSKLTYGLAYQFFANDQTPLETIRRLKEELAKPSAGDEFFDRVVESMLQVDEAARTIRETLDANLFVLPESAVKPIEEATDRVAEYIAQLQQQADTLGFSAAEMDAYQLSVLRASDQQKALAAALRESIDAWNAQQEAVASAKQIYEQTRTPLERLQQQIAEANQARLLGGLDDESYRRFVEQAQDAFDQIRMSAERSAGGVRGAFDDLSREMESINRHFASDSMRAMRDGLSGFFTDIATGGKSAGDALKDFARGFAQSMAQIASQALATFLVLKTLDAIYPGLGQATATTLQIGTGRANGGPVTAGTLYPVNERGPELLTAGGKDYLMMGGAAGMVTPSERIGGGANIRIINTPHPELMGDWLGSAPGERVVMNIIRRNPGIVRQIAAGQLV